jgi:hypothetical protein
MATNDPDSNPDADVDVGAPTVRHDGEQLTAEFTTTDTGTSVCTIYPATVGNDEQTAAWIRAEEDSFFSASDCC